MTVLNISYREVIPDISIQENWTEIVLNIGGTQSTLQDFKVPDRAGGYCFKNVKQNHNRNRFIYWRTHQDTLELSEVSLDFNLYQNNLRYKFSDSPVMSVDIVEQDVAVTILVMTVCSLHCITFPHPDTLAESNSNSSTSGCSNTSIDGSDSSQSFSIFRKSSAEAAKKAKSFYVLDPPTGATANNPVPFAAYSSTISSSGEVAFFALATQGQLILYIMNCQTGQTTLQLLKEHNSMPRLLTNIKDAFIGKNEMEDVCYVSSLLFTTINEQVYLLSLHRNDLLRIWSTRSFQTISLISCVWEGNYHSVQGPQNNMLRAISDTSICAFLSHSTGSEFVCLDLHTSRNIPDEINIIRRRVVTAPQLDLTDFNASTKKIWALWNNAEGEFSISHFSLENGSGMHWVSAAMEPPPDRYGIGSETGMNTREAYCSYIFHPGKFDRNVIAKALFMFRRTNVNFDAKHCGTAMLKDHVCQAIEDEIQSELKDFDITDDEYIEVSTRLWERFFSCCEQYYVKSNQPIGIVNLHVMDAMCVVKKNSFSLLRPCDTLEHLMLAGQSLRLDDVEFIENGRIGRSSIGLMEIVSNVEKWLPEDMKIDLERRMFQLQNPNDLIKKLADALSASTSDSSHEISSKSLRYILQRKIQGIQNLRACIETLLNDLRMDNGNPEAMNTYSSLRHKSRFLSNIGALFGSHVGLSILMESARQTVMIRFSICRNLLILMRLFVDLPNLPSELVHQITEEFIPNGILLLRAYYSMVWIVETPVNLNGISALEPAIQRLEQLKLINGSGRIYSNGSKTNVALLLSLFLNAKGLYAALNLYASASAGDFLADVTWQNTLMPLTTIICQLIWPISLNFVFGEWILSTCQHNVIEGYVRLLSKWCKWNQCSREFILAISHLNYRDAYKAYEIFTDSAKGGHNEPFLANKLFQKLENVENSQCIDTIKSNQAISMYYLKVIEIFEQYNELDYVILIAKDAIGLLKQTNPQLPMFQSILFNNHLQLEHYEEAYHSLIVNVDPARRKDCLRQLVITLFSRKHLDILMNFSYTDLREEFEHIVESRARSLVMEHNEMYDFLYAFHAGNSNMRKASAAMYEQAMRYKMEGDTIEHMDKRCISLMFCVNALNLIDERYRWIAKPVISDELLTTSTNNNNSSSNNVIAIEFIDSLAPSETTTNNSIDDENMTMEQMEQTTTTVIVLEIADIQREYLLAESLVLLAKHENKSIQSYIKAGPTELSMILASVGLITNALRLAAAYDVSLVPIFESLVSACVRTATQPVNQAWSWLLDNDLAVLPLSNSTVEMAWSLLSHLIDDYESAKSTQIRKAVVNKLLNLNVFVPQWLQNSYKLDNCAELLQLYINHNRLLDASDLCKEMINAMLGSGSEYFNCRHHMTVTNANMVLPVNLIDLLLQSLKLNSSGDIAYSQALLELDEVVQKYTSTALRTANNKLKMNHQEKINL